MGFLKHISFCLNYIGAILISFEIITTPRTFLSELRVVLNANKSFIAMQHTQMRCILTR